MCLILNIETSSTNCSVALSEGKTIIQLKEDKSNDYSHGEQLHTFISNILNQQNISVKNLAAISVSQGPGSYTGLRIGTATAKGLCHAHNLPLISISTLEAVAHLINVNQNNIIIPCLDARRDDVYYAILDHDYSVIKNNSSGTLTNELFKSFKNNSLNFVGPGSEKAKKLLKRNSSKNSFFYGSDYLPSAKTLANLSYEKFKARNFEELSNFEPIYLRVS